MKCILRTNIKKNDEDSLKCEVAIIRGLDHKNIIKCFDFFVEPTTFYIVMEYAKGGELFHRIRTKEFYHERDARDVVCCLLSAIKYCHDKNIVHRDLKPENLLLCSNYDDTNVKIADFGFATICGKLNII